MQEKTIEILGETVTESEAIEALCELIDETDNGILLRESAQPGATNRSSALRALTDFSAFGSTI